MRFALFGYAVLATIIAITAIVFMVQPIEPLMFYKDLGFNWEIIEWANHTIRSPTDLVDALAWSPGFYAQQFYQNSEVGDLPGVVVARLLGNSWLAVKVVEVLQAMVAAVGAYAMYATASKARSWRIIFATLYATLPLDALMIRGNEDFGWISALLPGILAASRTLLRRYGVRAIPMVGLLAGLGGYVIAIQFILFTSIPIFILSLAGVSGQQKQRHYAVLLLLGAVTCVAGGAFYVIPTFVHPLLSDSTPRSVSLLTHDFFGNFSQSWIGLLSLVETEFASSPVPLFNVSTALPILFIPGCTLWVAAIVHLITTKQRTNTWANVASVSAVAACVILSLGASIPILGGALWNLLYQIPHVDAIRTVDRFLAIPPLFVSFWAVTAFERASVRFPLLRSMCAFALLAICTIFVVFDHLEGVFTVDPTISSREPEINAVQAIVTAADSRVASFAKVDGGSADDAPMYGRPQPVPWLTEDIGSRFLWDGVGGSGLLGRAGISAVITAPSWTYDESSLPNLSNVYDVVPSAALRYSSPEGIAIWNIPHRGDATAIQLDCAHGGPAVLDILATRPEYNSLAFGEVTPRCRADDFFDYNPLDDWKTLDPIDSWSGRQLGLGSDELRDSDYQYFLNRTFLDIPWYRNSVDGQRPAFDSRGVVRVVDERTATIEHHNVWPAGANIYIRLAAHEPTGIYLRARTSIIGTESILPRSGFVWHHFQLAQPVEADEPVSLSIVPEPASATTQEWSGIAIDGLVVLRRFQPLRGEPRITHLVVTSLNRLDNMTIRRNDNVASSLQEPPVDLGQPNQFVSMKPSSLRSSTLLATGGRAIAKYRWAGPAGRYLLDATAQLSQNGILGLSVNEDTRCCEVFATSAGSDTITSALGIFDIDNKSKIHVEMNSEPFKPSDGNNLVSVRATRIQPIEIDQRYSLSKPLDLLLSDPVTAMRVFDNEQNVEFKSDGMHGVPGSVASMSFHVKGKPTLIVVKVASADEGAEAGVARLDCGGHPVATRLLVLRELIVRNASAHPRCELRVRWGGPQMRLLDMTIGNVNPGSVLLQGNIWIPAGRYHASVIKSNGLIDGDAHPIVKGCAAKPPILCAFPKAAYREVSIVTGASDDKLLAFSATDGGSKLTPPRVERTDLFRWRLNIAHTTDIVVTQLNDGNWILKSAAREIPSESCDIVDSCFRDVTPGEYRLFHRWPVALKIGFWISICAVCLSFLILSLPRRHLKTVVDS